MESRRSKPAGKHVVASGTVVAQDESGGIVALAAQTQQVFVQAPRQIQFTAEHVIPGLSIRDLEELRGKTELLPQLSCSSEDATRFWRGVAFGRNQGHT